MLVVSDISGFAFWFGSIRSNLGAGKVALPGLGGWMHLLNVSVFTGEPQIVIREILLHCNAISVRLCPSLLSSHVTEAPDVNK